MQKLLVKAFKIIQDSLWKMQHTPWLKKVNIMAEEFAFKKILTAQVFHVE